jgi:gamma-glutamyltranspeptidase/glutathione hydrolase
VIAQNQMAAASQPLASQIAQDTIKRCGKAIDPVIADTAALSRIEPVGLAIGTDSLPTLMQSADAVSGFGSIYEGRHAGY